jgi:hypothetical protein
MVYPRGWGRWKTGKSDGTWFEASVLPQPSGDQAPSGWGTRAVGWFEENRQRQRRWRVYIPHLRIEVWGHPHFCGGAKENGRASHDAHLSDDETVAKMGHPALWRFTHISESRCGAPGFVGRYTLRNCFRGYFGSGVGMLAWSGGGSFLVSCQVSSSVLIWSPRRCHCCICRS